MSAQRFLVGIDVGGTFTDVVARASDGQTHHAKVPSIPGEQWLGVLNALGELGINAEDIQAFVHGTTIVTNALLERKGAKTALVVTHGFRDVLEVGKCRRLAGGLFDPTWQRPKPVVPRNMRFEVLERLGADGALVTALDPKQGRELAKDIKAAGTESIAIAFINSYVDARHEVELKALLETELPGVPICTSAQLTPERGEFERTSTAALNAYLTPTMHVYLDALNDALESKRIHAPVNIMGSNGGTMSLSTARQRCAGTFLSGPVGGVVGAVSVAKAVEERNVITLDMGGTSTDVALIDNLKPRLSFDNQIDAWPLKMPQLDIHTIGAGGGSIVHRLDDGTLSIGPQSAGALPGPACYGRGGTAPTISDANLLLGRLPSDRPLAGGLELNESLASEAFRTLDSDDVTSLALAAVQIAVAKMAGAVREVSVHRGFDPRDFALLGFGGAGPMFAMSVAEELGIERVIIPKAPGHLSAQGQMLADVRHDTVTAFTARFSDLTWEALELQLAELRDSGFKQLDSDGTSAGDHRFEHSADIRYVGQAFTLQVPFEPSSSSLNALREAFDERHEETFGYRDIKNDVEVVNLRVTAVGVVEKLEQHDSPTDTTEVAVRTRKVRFDDLVDCPVYDRSALTVEQTFEGPAVIEEAGGTTVVPPDWTVRVHPNGSLICTGKVRW